MSRTSDIHDELSLEWSSLLAAWQVTRANWKDGVAGQFEKRFLGEWESDVPAYMAALEALEEELRACQRALR